MSRGELSLDLFGTFGIVVAGTVVGIGIIMFILGDAPPETEFEQGVSDYCLKVENDTVVGRTEFQNLLNSYLAGCDEAKRVSMGFTLLREDMDSFALEEGISSGGEPSVIYSENAQQGQEFFRGIIIGRQPARVVIREGETVRMNAEGESVVVY